MTQSMQHQTCDACVHRARGGHTHVCFGLVLRSPVGPRCTTQAVGGGPRMGFAPVLPSQGGRDRALPALRGKDGQPQRPGSEALSLTPSFHRPCCARHQPCCSRWGVCSSPGQVSSQHPGSERKGPAPHAPGLSSSGHFGRTVPQEQVPDSGLSVPTLCSPWRRGSTSLPSSHPSWSSCGPSPPHFGLPAPPPN